VKLGYPSADEEIQILDDQQINHPIDRIEPVISLKELLSIQEITQG